MFPAAGVLITFESVIEDSRCPAEARCIWAGAVELAFAVANGFGGQADSIQLRLDSTQPEANRAVLEDGTTVILTAVHLYPSLKTITPPCFVVSSRGMKQRRPRQTEFCL